MPKSSTHSICHAPFRSVRTLPDRSWQPRLRDCGWTPEWRTPPCRRMPPAGGNQGTASACRSTTKVPRLNPAMMLFRCGKFSAEGEFERECADQGALLLDFEAQGAIAPWVDDVYPDPSTASVMPCAASAPRCAALSMPEARPLVMASPRPARYRRVHGRVLALGVGLRLPTIANAVRSRRPRRRRHTAPPDAVRCAQQGG